VTTFQIIAPVQSARTKLSANLLIDHSTGHAVRKLQGEEGTEQVHR
jgi:hypothetical protein